MWPSDVQSSSLVRIVCLPDAFASLTGNSLSIDLAKEALKDLLAKDNKPITPNDILKVVAAHYGIKVTDLKSKSNARPIAYPRQVAMYLMRRKTEASLVDIGRELGGRDHSTVLHAVRVVRRKLPLFAALPPSGETRPA